MERLTEEQALEERRKYVAAFNDTMIKIWQEQITLLDVIDTGRLLQSPVAIRTQMDGKVSEVHLSQAFLEYGLWQDYGTGKETPRGNSGDLGRAKKRQARRWFSRKFYMSYKNISEFFEESLGRQFCGLMTNAFDKKTLGRK
jgi:hypothetical protein